MAEQTGPSTDIQTPAQYPNATRIENGTAYDISGKALGPVNGQQPASQQPAQDEWSVLSTEPAKPDQKQDDPWAVTKTEPAQQQSKSALDRYAGAFNQTLTGSENLSELYKKASDYVHSVHTAAPQDPELPGLGAPSAGQAKFGQLVKDLAAQAWEGQKHETQAGLELMREPGVLGKASGAVRYVQGGLPLIGPALGAIEENFAKGNYAEGLGIATALLLPGAIGKHGAPAIESIKTKIGQAAIADTEKLIAAAKTHDGARAAFDARSKEVQIASSQAEAAATQAELAREAEGKGEGTRDQTVEAENLASQAQANYNKAQKAVKDAGETRAQTAVDVDRLHRKVQRSLVKTDEKQAQQTAQATDDFIKAFPPTPRGAASYTPSEAGTIIGVLKDHHENIENISNPEQVYNALQHATDENDVEIKPYAEKYSNEPLTTNVMQDVHDELARNPREDFIERGLKALEPYNLTDPTVGEVEGIGDKIGIRTQINSEMRKILNANGEWHIENALLNSPEFAALSAAADSLREGVLGTFEDKGVQGIDKLREEQRVIIKGKYAVAKKLGKGDQVIRGAAQSGPIRQMLAKSAEKIGIGTGILAGAKGGLVGTELGAVSGGYVGRKIGEAISPRDPTRNQLIKNFLKVDRFGTPRPEIVGEGAPSSPPSFPVPPAPTSEMSPRDVLQVQREFSPLHADLAAHYGESVHQSGYGDLEQRFMEDIGDKQQHGVALEPGEKTLLSKINQQNAVDELTARQQEQEAAVKNEIPQANLPENPTSPRSVRGLPNGMSVQEAITHELAHAHVANELGLSVPNGIRSETHSANMKAGALMSVPIDLGEFIGEDGEVDLNKMKQKMPDLAATYVAGGVANDMWHNIPFDKNDGLGADLGILRKFMKKVGFTDAESAKMIAVATDHAQQLLSQPGVKDLMEQHAAVRESGLDDTLHVSPERLQQILQDLKGKQDEISIGDTARDASRANGEGDATNKPNGAGGEGQAKAGNSEVVPNKAEGSSKGQRKGTEGKPAEGTETAEPLKAINPTGVEKSTIKGTPRDRWETLEADNRELQKGIESGKGTPEDRTAAEQRIRENEVLIKHYKENPTTGAEENNPKLAAKEEPKDIVEKEGLKYKGELAPGTDVHMFEHPDHPGKTAAMKGPLTPEAVREKMAGKLKEFGVEPKVAEDLNPKLSADRVSQRLPEGKDATENPLVGEPLTVGREALSRTPDKLQQKIADRIRSYPGVKIPESIKDPKKVFDRFVNHVSDNLKFMYNQVEPAKQEANAKWYESANKLAKDMSQEHGITHPQAAGVIATQSPQKDWDMNVSLAKRITDIVHNHADEPVTPEMVQKGRELIQKSRKNQKAEALPANKKLEEILDKDIAGRKFSEMTDPFDRAAFVRLYDETYNPRSFHYIDPATGNATHLRTNADGSLSDIAWGTLPQIDNALSIIQDGSRENISKRLGGMHKVRNFYNNIIDPTNNQDVTIDTHAVGAGLMQAVGGNSNEVLDNFGRAGGHKGTGVEGTYPLYADAYRKAADELGIKPRELQSVVWEHIRNMFPSEWKSKANEQVVKAIWKKYSDGKQSLNQTRQQILDLSEQAQKQVQDKQKKTLDKAKKSAYTGGINALEGSNE